MRPSALKRCSRSNAALSCCGWSRSGATSPTAPNTCASAEPARRLRPLPRSISTRRVAASAASCGVSERRTSATGANAEITSDSGEVCVRVSPSCCQTAFIDSESLPTGIAMPRLGHSSSPTAFTASNRRASSSPWPQAAIQFADRRMSDSLAMCAAARFVIASPTAMRALAAASTSAMTGRSPIAIASPVVASKPVAVTAQSATGTCQGPTIWSRTVRPPTVRSPIVIRNCFEATQGSLRIRSAASFTKALRPGSPGFG